jgi:hypothetical protein
MYARLRQYKEAWPEYKKAVDALDTVLEHVDIPSRPALQMEAGSFRWAAAPREGGGNTDKPYQVFLNNVNAAGGTPAVAGAILFLFDLGKKGTRLTAEIHRAETAWNRANELNARRK